MAKAQYVGVNSVARKVKKPYIGVGGVARKVKNGYVGVNGVARLHFSGEVSLGELNTGTSVYMNVNGVSTEFIVIHQGLPSSLYDSSCNGTWLLMKDLYVERAWDSLDNDYANSDIHTYLNGTFLGLLDSDIQSAVKQVKIPYQNGTGSGGSVASGSSGLPTKIFLLSGYEVGWTTSTNQKFPVDGACLSYFSGTFTTDSKRIGYYDGTATVWWLRSPSKSNSSYVWFVNDDGRYDSNFYIAPYGVRPALILPSDTVVDESFNIIA